MLHRSLAPLVAVAFAVFASQPALAHEGTHEGKVVKAGGGKLTLALIQKEKEKQHTMTMNVAANATIMLDEEPAKLEDLKEGFHVKVTNDAKHVISKIEAHLKAPVASTFAHAKEAEKGDEHAKHVKAKTAGHKGEQHAKHDDHKDHGHKTVEHKGHKAGAHHGSEIAPEGKVKIGDKVPDFAVRTLDGKSVRLSELQKDQTRTKSGVVVLSFWCSTCHSCRDVEHLLAKLYKDYAGQAAVFALGANADETGESVTTFVKENRLELPVVLDPTGDTADLFGVNVTTTTVVIDGNGVLRYCGQFQHKAGGSAAQALKMVLAGKEVAIKTTPHLGCPIMRK